MENGLGVLIMIVIVMGILIAQPLIGTVLVLIAGVVVINQEIIKPRK